jgi:2'-phosphotransferase
VLNTPVIHGTNFRAWKSIQNQGLSKMDRNHVHFAIGLPDDPNVKSGMRKTSQVFIYINVEKAKKGKPSTWKCLLCLTLNYIIFKRWYHFL